MADSNASFVDGNQVALASAQHAQGAPLTLSSTEIAMAEDHSSAKIGNGGEASLGAKVTEVQETPADRQAVGATAVPSTSALGAGNNIFDKAQEVPVKKDVSQQSSTPAEFSAQHTQVRQGFHFLLSC